MGRQEPKNRPRFTPDVTAVLAWDSHSGAHTLVIANDNGNIRAACSVTDCDPGQWRSGKDAYEQVKKDWAEQHNGGKR